MIMLVIDLNAGVVGCSEVDIVEGFFCPNERNN